MGLRRDFSEHKNKTIGAFNLISSDISNVHVNMAGLRTILSASESRLHELTGRISNLNAALDRCLGDVELQKSKDLILSSTIEGVNNSITDVNSRLASFERMLSGRISSFEGRLKTLSSESAKISQRATANSNLLKKLLPGSKSQSAAIKKMGYSLRESQDDIKKIRNLINRKVKSVKRADAELEAKLISQRRRMAQLNRKIELNAGRKVSVRRASRRATRKTTSKTPARKVITKKITRGKTVTTIKTPKRTITKTVTPKRTVTKKVTPKTKEVYEVIKEKNPLI